MKLSLRQKQSIRILVNFLILGGLFGIAIAITLTRQLNFVTFLRGFALGFIISFFGILGNHTFLQSFRKLSFPLFILIKTVYISLVGVAVISIRIFSGARSPGYFKEQEVILIVVAFSLTISLFFNLFLMFRRMLGQHVLSNFFTGKYHHPKEEERIFMFLDIVSSTTLAEKIGHIRFHNFLNDVFFEITDAILSANAKIYKYVGDEIIINWKLKEGIKNNSCVELYFNIEETLKRKKDYYIEKYTTSPHFRAGLHSGKVIVGELGDLKREIAFLGNTVNTTARIQEACKLYQEDLLLSKYLYNKLNLTEHYQSKNLGQINLKGKEEKIELISINRNDT